MLVVAVAGRSATRTRFGMLVAGRSATRTRFETLVVGRSATQFWIVNLNFFCGKTYCRGSSKLNRHYKYLFVGAVQSTTALRYILPQKKFKFIIQNRVAERPTTNIPNRVRVAERPATSVRVAECPATNVLNRVRVAERPATATTSTRVLYKL